MYYVYTLQGEGYKTNSMRQAVAYLHSLGIRRSLANAKKWMARDGEWFSDVQSAGIARYDAHQLRDIPFAPTVDDFLWTDAEIRILLDHYEKQGPAFCHEVLIASGFDRRSRTVVGQTARRLGLRYQGPALGQFRKGNISANTGKKMPGDLYRKCAPTMYKKGNMSGAAQHNYKPIGAESIVDGYYKIKLAEGKWAQKHQVIWQQAHGPIPAGHIVVFRDGNSLNCVLENLELITRAELCKRNRWGAGPSTYSLLTGRAAKARLNRRGIGDRAIRLNPDLLEAAQAETLLIIQKKKKRHG